MYGDAPAGLVEARAVRVARAKHVQRKGKQVSRAYGAGSGHVDYDRRALDWAT